MELDSLIEAVLFLEGEPIKIKRLADFLNKSEEETRNAVAILEKKLEGRGLRLIKKDDEVLLATAAEAAAICEAICKEEFNKDIGRAGLEVLAIIVYQGPLTRAEIDYIRGVNSSFTVRNLLVRGLIERRINPKDNRSFLYSPSFRLLEYLGISEMKQLPHYEDFKREIEKFMEEQEKNPME